MSFVSHILILAGLQGLVLSIALRWIQKRNKKANRILAMLVILISLMLFGQTNYTENPQMIWQSLYTLFLDLVLFVYAPLFYLYVKQLFYPFSSSDDTRNDWLHFVPSITYAIAVFFILFNSEYLYWLAHKGTLPLFDASIKYLGFIYSFIYLVACLVMIRNFSISAKSIVAYELRTKFIKVIISFMVIAWLLWCYNFIGDQLEITVYVFFQYRSLWIVLALLTYLFGYYMLSHQQLFQVDEMEGDGKKALSIAKYQSSPAQDEVYDQVKSRLEHLMQEEKPFKEPGLTLESLAKKVGTNRVILSRVINESYGKNFFDYVNHYRIEEFIEIAKRDRKSFTFTGMAYDVGFNTRTTFYKAFKKFTNTTPKLYFKDKN